MHGDDHVQTKAGMRCKSFVLLTYYEALFQDSHSKRGVLTNTLIAQQVISRESYATLSSHNIWLTLAQNVPYMQRICNILYKGPMCFKMKHSPFSSARKNTSFVMRWLLVCFQQGAISSFALFMVVRCQGFLII